MTFVVGLTGGIGSGKSTVAELFVARGARLVDTDAIAHALTAPGGAAMPALRAAFGDDMAAADGALDWSQRCDRVLVVDCPPEVQRARVMARSGLAADEVDRIIAAQATRAQRLAAADDVIDNTGGLQALNERVDALHRHYLNLAATRPA